MGLCLAKNSRSYQSYGTYEARRGSGELSLTRKEIKELRGLGSRSAPVLADCYRRESMVDGQLKLALTHPLVARYLTEYFAADDDHGVRRSLELAEYRALSELRRLDDLGQSDEVASLLDAYFERFGRSKLLLGTMSEQMEYLRLVQYRLFFDIQEGAWIPFCSTKQYQALARQKQIRQTLKLFQLELGEKPSFYSVLPPQII